MLLPQIFSWLIPCHLYILQMSPPERGLTIYLQTTFTPDHALYNFSTLLFLESITV